MCAKDTLLHAIGHEVIVASGNNLPSLSTAFASCRQLNRCMKSDWACSRASTARSRRGMAAGVVRPQHGTQELGAEKGHVEHAQLDPSPHSHKVCFRQLCAPAAKLLCRPGKSCSSCALAMFCNLACCRQVFVSSRGACMP